MNIGPFHEDRAKHRVTQELVRDLLGGTSSMRGMSPTIRQDSTVYSYAMGDYQGATPWLPMLDTDTTTSYRRRWDRAYLFGGLSSAVSRIVSDVFSEPVAVEGLPAAIERIEKSADRSGTSLHRFWHEQFLRKVAFGLSATLVLTPDEQDLPSEAMRPDSPEDAPQVSVAGARTFDVRPYLVAVHRMDIADWEFEETLVGPRLRWIEIDQKPVKRSREAKDSDIVYRRTRLRKESGTVVLEYLEASPKVARRSRQGAEAKPSDWVVVRSRSLPSVTEIPIVIDAASDETDTDGPLCVGVPFDELAWLNLEHFRVNAENNVALHTAQAEFPIEYGAKEEDLHQPLNVGLGRAKRTTSRPDEYDIKFVGPTGKGVELGMKKLAEIESRMERLGAQPLVRQNSTNTATGRRIDEQGKQSQAMTWAADTEQAIEQALRIAAQMAGGAGDVSDSEIKVTLKGIQTLSPDERDATFGHVLEMHTRGIVETREVIRAAVRLRILPGDTDIDAMAETAAKEEVEKLRRMTEVENMFAAGAGQGDEGDDDDDDEAAA